ncbi:hypothetical protein Syn7502_02281 [Synechococcus sp. PCC 7502]|uniref:hypothetical protein n=1 Tax=Synechococcus sp. PCC 7502 TaxID=1173263 RepID=UPI00029FEB40|nr:hypothetical protein [Synechococcus sp. PCC 7502]AFY74286.1 hypothetical protein Syn7502_02281 [Synechococcus sp. PCC 7502]
MNNTKLTLTAIKLILTGFALLVIVLISSVIQILSATIKAITIRIKLLNDWCDDQSSTHPKNLALSAFNVIGLLSGTQPRTLITPPVLPSSGVVIVPMTQNTITVHKKRGRPKKLAIA